MKTYIVVSYVDLSNVEVIAGYDSMDEASEFVADLLKENTTFDPDDVIIYEMTKR